MRTPKITILIFLVSMFEMQGFSQDTLYAMKIDSLWLHSYDAKLLAKKRETISKVKVEYSFDNNPKTLKSIVVLDKASKENLLFYFMEDKLVMISPSGQYPYFVLNDKVVFTKEMKHTPKQVDDLIEKGYTFLERGYGKIKRFID